MRKRQNMKHCIIAIAMSILTIFGMPVAGLHAETSDMVVVDEEVSEEGKAEENVSESNTLEEKEDDNVLGKEEKKENILDNDKSENDNLESDTGKKIKMADLVISNAKELKEFAQSVNSGNSYSGQLVVLANDIVFDKTVNNFTPIEGFGGTFDGLGYSISGINITVFAGSYGGKFTNVAPFATVVNGGIVKNLTICDSEFQANSLMIEVAGIVAKNSGRIMNCSVVDCLIKGIASDISDVYAGGIAGYNDGGINNCYSDTKQEIYASNTGDMYVGGIVGYSTAGGCVRNCCNLSPESVSYTASTPKYSCFKVHEGGIVGYLGEKSSIYNCYNIGVLTSAGTDENARIGSIVGESFGKVTNCYASEEAFNKVFGYSENKDQSVKTYPITEIKEIAFLEQLNSNLNSENDYFEWEIRPESLYPLPTKVKDIGLCNITVQDENCVYDGDRIPTITVTDEDETLISGKDYMVIYENNTDAGTAIATIVGEGKYTRETSVEFTIKKATPVFQYTRVIEKLVTDDAFKLNIKQTKGNGVLTYHSSDDTLAEVSSNGEVEIKKDGEVIITVSSAETQNYKAMEVEIVLTIAPQIDIATCCVELLNNENIYNGSAQKPEVLVTHAGSVLTLQEDYTVSYLNNTAAGIATVKVFGKGIFYGEVSKNFMIAKQEQILEYTPTFQKAYSTIPFALNVKRTVGDGALTYSSSNPNVATVNASGMVQMIGVGDTTITVNASETMNCKAVTAQISVRVEAQVSNADISDAFVNNNASNANVAVSEIGNVKSFKITAKKKGFVLTWKKVSEVDGYQIQVSAKRNFSGAKTYIVNKNKKKYNVSSLKAKKKYYVRICAYKYYKDADGMVQKAYGKHIAKNKKTK